MNDAYRDEHLAARLRVLLADAKITIKDAAQAIDVPYRTLQNQLAGNNRMPASTFAKLVEMLEITPQFVARGRLRLNRHSLTEALIHVLRDLVPVVDEEYVLRPPGIPDSRTQEERQRHAKAIAFLLEDRYELLQGRLKYPHYEVSEGPQS